MVAVQVGETGRRSEVVVLARGGADVPLVELLGALAGRPVRPAQEEQHLLRTLSAYVCIRGAPAATSAYPSPFTSPASREVNAASLFWGSVPGTPGVSQSRVVVRLPGPDFAPTDLEPTA